jgi:Iap family predicted aminopeptidase
MVIKKEGFYALIFTDSSYVECCLKSLSVEIGARPAGSSSHRRAADFIAQEMRQAGCEVLWQEYPCPDWQALSCQLVIAGREIPANANTHSPSCDVTGQLIPIGSYEELVNLDISGQIAVLHGDITKAGFFPKNFDYFRDEKQDQFMELLLAKEPAVIITVSHYEGLRPALLADSDLLVPSVTVARQEGSRLLQNPGAEARVTIKSSSRISRGANLIGQRSQNSSKKVVLMAHYDTVPGTPGALDNGAGIAALLLLARSLKEIPMENSLELVAFGGEDSWYPGDALYIKEYPPDDVIAAINIDGIGLKNCNTTLAALLVPSP